MPTKKATTDPTPDEHLLVELTDRNQAALGQVERLQALVDPLCAEMWTWQNVADATAAALDSLKDAGVDA